MIGKPPRRPHRRIPLAEQLRRRRELDDIRLQRVLTAEERAEDDDLAERAYQRAYRQSFTPCRASAARNPLIQKGPF